MENQPRSLGDALACLRHTAQAPRETCVFVPAAIHTLIAALFARILDRLEQLLLLWQTGTLATPQRDRERGEAASLPSGAPSAAQSRTRHPRARSTARRAPARPGSLSVPPAIRPSAR